jgi:hypothetical protein
MSAYVAVQRWLREAKENPHATQVRPDRANCVRNLNLRFHDRLTASRAKKGQG